MADEQSGLWDVVLENEELEAALEMLDDYETLLSRFKNEHDSKELAAARKLYKETIEATARDRGLAGGARVRVGQFVVETTRRSGGGFEVPNWSKVLAKHIERLPGL